MHEDWTALARAAVEAARAAGAQYADARVTRTVQHRFNFGQFDPNDREETGIGVRALVNGYWGFAAAPSGDRASVERLARLATAQAAVNAKGALPRTVELSPRPAATGQWATPVTIDPFAVSFEEKFAMMDYWQQCAKKMKMVIDQPSSGLHFARQERVLVTSDGTSVTQTVYESGGVINVKPFDNPRLAGITSLLPIQGIETAGGGWELFLDAKIPEQLQAMPDRMLAVAALQKDSKPGLIGQYTLVCDGATMAALVAATVGVATQLDRALGYEANAGGTSFITDPLAMVGNFPLAASVVTVTANRTAPAQLATVQWDEEGVVPPTVTLVKDGVLTDFQTTREQASWLAPYYAKSGLPGSSHGHAEAEDALGITLQQMPNLALEPTTASVSVANLIANVPKGILLEGGVVGQMDSQRRTGLLGGHMREITNGRLGRSTTGLAVLFDALQLWKKVTAVGGAQTRMTVPFSQYPYGGARLVYGGFPVKGQPPQASSFSVAAPAAIIESQALINPLRKA
jgi:TldD protein